MPSERIQLDYPRLGVVLNSGYEDQPRGSSREIRNMRPRDWAHNGLMRGAQRPGLAKIVVGGQMPDDVRAIQHVRFPSAVGQIAVSGSALLDETFTRANTAPFSDDIDGGGTDWTIVNGDVCFGNVLNGTVPGTPSGALRMSTTRGHVLRFGDGTKAGGTTSFADTSQDGRADDYGSGENGDNPAGTADDVGPHIISNAVQDNVDIPGTANINVVAASSIVSTPYSESNVHFVKGHLCIYTGATSLPSDNFVAEVSFTTRGTISGRFGAVGLSLGINSTKLTTPVSSGLPDWDGSLHVGVGRGTPEGNAGSSSFDEILFANVNANDCTFDLGGVMTTAAWDSFAFATSTTYTLRLAKSGSLVEFYIKTGSGAFTLMWYATSVQSKSDGSSLPVDPSGTKVGFWMSGVSSTLVASFISSVDDFRVYNASASSVGDRFVAVSSGHVYYGSDTESWTAASGGTSAISSSQRIVSAEVNYGESGLVPFVHLADGTNLKVVNAREGSVSNWTATTGDVPGGPTSKPKYLSRFRDRATLYGWADYPTVIYQSRRFEWFDWNYTPTDPDGNEAVNFQIDDPVTCFGPFTRDLGIIASSRKAYMLVGDFALGGYIDPLSDHTGIVGPQAFTIDDEGNAYFVGLDGLFRIPKGTRDLERLSEGRIDKFFDDIDYDTSVVRLIWLRGQDSLLVLVEPTTPASSTKHLVWDRQTDGFSFDTYPADMVPRSFGYYADGALGERVMFGGGDGYVRWFDPTVNVDDGTAIDRYLIHPLLGGGLERVIITGAELKLGGLNDDAYLELVRANSAEDLYSAPASFSRRVRDGKTVKRFWECVGGTAVGVVLRSSDAESPLSIDRLAATVETSGRSSSKR